LAFVPGKIWPAALKQNCNLIKTDICEIDDILRRVKKAREITVQVAYQVIKIRIDR